jgi:hypothetical protein
VLHARSCGCGGCLQLLDAPVRRCLTLKRTVALRLQVLRCSYRAAAGRRSATEASRGCHRWCVAVEADVHRSAQRRRRHCRSLADHRGLSAKKRCRLRFFIVVVVAPVEQVVDLHCEYRAHERHQRRHRGSYRHNTHVPRNLLATLSSSGAAASCYWIDRSGAPSIPTRRAALRAASLPVR